MKRLLYAVSTCLLASQVYAQEATIFLVEGQAYAQKGAIQFNRPNIGDKPESGSFGFFRNFPKEPFKVEYKEESRRLLNRTDKLAQEEVITTKEDGFLRLLLEDESILDIGPNSTVQLVHLPKGRSAETRQVLVLIATGMVRSVLASSLLPPSTYELDTVSGKMHIRQKAPYTETLISASEFHDEKAGYPQTEVLALHGHVAVDLFKLARENLVYTNPEILTAKFFLRAHGPNGILKEVSVRELKGPEFKQIKQALNPQLQIHGTVLAHAPDTTLMPGTGVWPQKGVENFEKPKTFMKSELIPQSGCSQSPVVGKLSDC